LIARYDPAVVYLVTEIDDDESLIVPEQSLDVPNRQRFRLRQGNVNLENSRARISKIVPFLADSSHALPDLFFAWDVALRWLLAHGINERGTDRIAELVRNDQDLAAKAAALDKASACPTSG
jgi:hypothetical protein